MNQEPVMTTSKTTGNQNDQLTKKATKKQENLMLNMKRICIKKSSMQSKTTRRYSK